MNQPDQFICNDQSSLYNTVNKISQEQCMESEKSYHQEKNQKILSQLEESNIVEMHNYHSDGIKQTKQNKQKQREGYNNETASEKYEIKNDKKFTFKPSMDKQKLQNMSIEYMDQLFKELKCTKHWQNNERNNHQQLFICLENQCDYEKINTQPKIGNLISLDSRISKENKFVKSQLSSVKSTLENINGNTCMQKQGSKQTKIKEQIQEEIQVQMVLTQGLKKLESRILCQECLNEKLHRGHQICTLKKFESLVCQYHWSSIQATKDLLSKIIQLKNNIDYYFNMLSNKAIEIMTLGMINDWQNYRNSFYKYNLSRNISSKLIHKNQQQIYSQTNKSPYVSKQSNNQNINIQDSLNIKQLFSINALEIWQQLLSTSKMEQKQNHIKKILKFKQQNILQQIQYIDNNFKNAIVSCITNIQFVNNYKYLLFNPDDMCQKFIGLTLDRNKIKGLKYLNKQQQYQQKFIKNNNITHCKIAFTQIPLLSENSRNFKIDQLKQEIIIGCVNSVDHLLISEKLQYENYQQFLDGISVNSEGQITVYNKGQKPYIAQFAKLSENDVIQVTLHTKNSTITFIKYSQASEEGEQTSTIKNTMKMEFKSLGSKMRNRTVIATLPIELIDNNSIYYLLAGVSSQGDCVSLTQNILIESRIGSPVKKVMKESQRTMKNKKESGIQNQIVVHDNFNKAKSSRRIDKSLS